MFQDEELSFSNKELQFSAIEMGEGPLVICLRRFPDCLHSFRHQMPRWPPPATVSLRPACAGMSLLRKLPRTLPIPVMTEDVIALMDHLGAEKLLIGHDWGAAITYMAAAAFPDRF